MFIKIEEIIRAVELRLSKQCNYHAVIGQINPLTTIHYFEHEDFIHRAFQLGDEKYHSRDLFFQIHIDSEKEVFKDPAEISYKKQLVSIKESIGNAIRQFSTLKLTTMECLKLEVMKNMLFSANSTDYLYLLLRFGLAATERFRQ